MDGDPLLDEDVILPADIEMYSIDGDHLPLPPGRRRELDRLFFDEGWEPEEYQGYERDPIARLPFPARMDAHIHKHRSDLRHKGSFNFHQHRSHVQVRLCSFVSRRLEAERAGWDVGAVLASNRKAFGPKGPLEVACGQLILHASRGELEAVSQIIQTGLVHPDVADSRGHTALMGATVTHPYIFYWLIRSCCS